MTSRGTDSEWYITDSGLVRSHAEKRFFEEPTQSRVSSRNRLRVVYHEQQVGQTSHPPLVHCSPGWFTLSPDEPSRWRFRQRSGGTLTDVIQREAWPFYNTSSGVRLCWELEEAKGPEGPKHASQVDDVAKLALQAGATKLLVLL